ncbi:DNA-deoxyinosine glycosylase [Mycolicibacterium thermoresistibile]
MVSKPLLHSFPPIVGVRPQLLILGNMPSVMSLAAQRYYETPRNAFWRIVGELLGFDPTAPYDDRLDAVRAARVAVWDVLRSCRRKGSLDSAVERDSMVPNDFHTFFAAHPTISRVVFNGAAAEANFARLTGDDFGLDYVRAPSTSPAQTMRYDAKLRAWRAALTPVTG